MSRYRKDLGDFGEAAAAAYLQKKQYQILEKNYRAAGGELDLIARTKTHLVFVEVKTRTTNDFGTPFEAITKSKYENIKKGIQFYLQEHKFQKHRIDVIGITLKPELKIEHLKNV